MDPNATLQALLEAIAGNEREDAIACMSILLEWLEKDGFMPSLQFEDNAPTFNTTVFFIG